MDINQADFVLAGENTTDLSVFGSALEQKTLIIKGSEETSKLDLSGLEDLTSGLSIDLKKGEVVSADDRLISFSDFNSIISSNFADTIIGDIFDNLIVSADGNDEIYSGLGDDIVFSGEGNDYVLAGRGRDTVYGGEGNDRIIKEELTHNIEYDFYNDFTFRKEAFDSLGKDFLRYLSGKSTLSDGLKTSGTGVQMSELNFSADLPEEFGNDALTVQMGLYFDKDSSFADFTKIGNFNGLEIHAIDSNLFKPEVYEYAAGQKGLITLVAAEYNSDGNAVDFHKLTSIMRGAEENVQISIDENSLNLSVNGKGGWGGSSNLQKELGLQKIQMFASDVIISTLKVSSDYSNSFITADQLSNDGWEFSYDFTGLLDQKIIQNLGAIDGDLQLNEDVTSSAFDLEVYHGLNLSEYQGAHIGLGDIGGSPKGRLNLSFTFDAFDPNTHEQNILKTPFFVLDLVQDVDFESGERAFVRFKYDGGQIDFRGYDSLHSGQLNSIAIAYDSTGEESPSVSYTYNDVGASFNSGGHSWNAYSDQSGELNSDFEGSIVQIAGADDYLYGSEIGGGGPFSPFTAEFATGLDYIFNFDTLKSDNLVDDLVGTYPPITLDVEASSGLLPGHKTLDDLLVNDSFFDGGPGNDELIAGSGDDEIYGGSGNDIIDGGSGDDTIYGGAGDDIINDGLGDDVVDAGDGIDTYRRDFDVTNPGEDWVPHVDLVNEGLYSPTFGDGLLRGDVLKNFENVELLGSLDTIVTGDGNDNVITTGAGDDIISDGYGDDFVDAGDGDDVIYNNGGTDQFVGGSGSDTLITDISSGFDAGSFEIVFDAVEGVHGRANSDIGQDTIVGIENFTLMGEFDADVTGGDEDNIFITDAGDDRIRGGSGDDTILSGAGDDTLLGGLGADRIDGGDGNDRLAFWDTEYTEGVQINLAENTVVDQYGNVDAIFNIENANGTDFNDVISGDSFDNGLDGNAGDDVLYGYEGSDSLWGREGNDQLYGGAGKDFFRGFSGNDTMVGGTGDDDKVSYDLDSQYGAMAGITADMSTGIVVDGYGDIDEISEIERLDATEFDDVVVGNSDDNTIQSFAGDDTIEGGAGSDLLYGGAGEDTAVFSGAASEYEIVRDGIVVYVTETATGDMDHVEGFELLQFGEGTEINITPYEIVSGGSGDDWLIGGSDADLIATNGGDDDVYGLAGDDRIEISGSGDVYVDTGEGADEIVVAADAQGSIEIISGGHGDTLLYEGYTGDVTYAHINKSGDLVFGTQDLDVILTDQMSYDSDVGKYVVSGVETITVEFGDEADYSESVSAVVGSDYKEGDLLYTNSANAVNVILAGAGADTIMVGSGNDVAEHTAIVGDLYNFEYSSTGSGESYDLQAVHYTNRDPIDGEPFQLNKIDDVIFKVKISGEYTSIQLGDREFGLDSAYSHTQRITEGDYYYDFMEIEFPRSMSVVDDPYEGEGMMVLLESNDPRATDTKTFFDELSDGAASGSDQHSIQHLSVEQSPYSKDNSDWLKNIAKDYGEVVDNSWETQNVSYGDELRFAWAREDVEITDHLNGYYEVEYIGEGADTGKVVEFTDIEKLVFEGGEGAPVEIQVIPGPVVGSAEWFVDNSWGGAAAGQDISFVDNNVELRVEGNTIKVYADVTVSETVMEMQSVKETYIDSRGRTKTRTVQKDVAVDKETSHEGELIWEGSHDSISGFDFADDEHVNVISVREEDIGGKAIEMTLGTDDTDLIFGTDGDNVIFGAGGDDLIVGGGGNDTILGGSGDDAILGGSGDDLLLGDFDEDVLRDEFAMSEEDIAAVLAGQLSDGSNNDLVIGGAGIDEVDGGEGNNVVISGGTDTGLEINGDGESNIQDIEDLIGRDLFEDEHWV